MDYQLFDDLERQLEERQSLLRFDKMLSDAAPDRRSQDILLRIVAQEEQDLQQMQGLYHSVMKQNYQAEIGPYPQSLSFAEGVESRLFREVEVEKQYGSLYIRSVDATFHRAWFELYCQAQCRVQLLLYLAIPSAGSDCRHTAGV